MSVVRLIPLSCGLRENVFWECPLENENARVYCFIVTLWMALKHGCMTIRLAAMIPTFISTIAIASGVMFAPGTCQYLGLMEQKVGNLHCGSVLVAASGYIISTSLTIVQPV